MEQHRADPLGVDELARTVNLSPSYLTRLFRQHTGQSPGRYDRGRRLDAAHALLRTTFLSVKEIMGAAGWNDPSHFCREFKRRFGVSPRAARQERRQNADGVVQEDVQRATHRYGAASAGRRHDDALYRERADVSDYTNRRS